MDDVGVGYKRGRDNGGGEELGAAKKKKKVVVRWVGAGKADKVEEEKPKVQETLTEKMDALGASHARKKADEVARVREQEAEAEAEAAETEKESEAVKPLSKRERKEQKKKAKKKKAKENRAAYNAKLMSEYESGFIEPVEKTGGDVQVQGEIWEGTLYLVDAKRSVVYSSTERTATGDMVRVGTWDAEKKAVFLDSSGGAGEVGEEEEDGGMSYGQRMLAKMMGKSGSVAEVGVGEAEAEEVVTPMFPFEADASDHCETSLEAYKDVEWLLARLTQVMGYGEERSKLRIYDPYYCNGAVVRNLATLGFTSVINVKEDFYRTVESGQMPEFDVMLTNPPYSVWPATINVRGEEERAYEDHCERLIQIAVSTGKPFLLLMPNYVYMKPYYNARLTREEEAGKRKRADMMYVTPKSRYSYVTPPGLRPGLSKAELITSPFVSFWYVHGGRFHKQIAKWTRTNKHLTGTANIALAAKLLPQNMKASNDSTRKRLRKNQRDARKRAAAKK